MQQRVEPATAVGNLGVLAMLLYVLELAERTAARPHSCSRYEHDSVLTRRELLLGTAAALGGVPPGAVPQRRLLGAGAVRRSPSCRRPATTSISRTSSVAASASWTSTSVEQARPAEAESRRVRTGDVINTHPA